MGYPINTSDNDIYFVSTNDGEVSYYATVRAGGFGLSDLYTIRQGKFEAPEVDSTATDSLTKKVVEKKNVILSLSVRDESGKLTAAKVQLINTENGSPAAMKKMSDGVYKLPPTGYQ